MARRRQETARLITEATPAVINMKIEVGLEKILWGLKLRIKSYCNQLSHCT